MKNYKPFVDAAVKVAITVGPILLKAIAAAANKPKK